MAEEELPPDYEMMPLIEGLGSHASKRKVRLFACACCRRIWSLLPDDACRAAVVAAEQFADKAVGPATLGDANKRAKVSHQAYKGRYTDPAYYATEACHLVTLSNANSALTAQDSVCKAQSQAAARRRGSRRPAENAARDALYREFTLQTHLLRDFLGNPSRPVAADPAWRTPAVVQLAQEIYDERAFDRMPALADALQNAGCDNADVLDHCRGVRPPGVPAEHARGCWVVDLLLGKA